MTLMYVNRLSWKISKVSDSKESLTLSNAGYFYKSTSQKESLLLTDEIHIHSIQH